MDNQYLILFTSIVCKKLQHPNICQAFIKNIEKHYNIHSKNIRPNSGLIDIYLYMEQYIDLNIASFIIDPTKRAY